MQTDILGKPMDKRRRPKSEGKSKLERWILKSGGTGTIARALEVSQPTVVNWCFRRRTPALETARKLVELSNGHLTYDDIIEGTSV